MSSVSMLYRRYLTVCNKWGIDSSKKGRDFGIYLRENITKLFPKGEFSEIEDLNNYEKQISALERLSTNHYFKHSYISTCASGLNRQQCQWIVSTEAMDYFNNKRGIKNKINNLFSFGKSKSEKKNFEEIDKK